MAEKYIILFWAIIAIGLLLTFVIVPICLLGFKRWVCEKNPIIFRLFSKWQYHKFRSLSSDWYNRIEVVSDCQEGEEIPNIQWVEDTATSKGIDSLYCLDQQADEVRPLLIKDWGLPYDKTQWFMAKQTDLCYFNPAIAAPPIYDMNRTDSVLHIKTGTKWDTWIWLVGKDKQPGTYRVDFDFVSHTKVQETLQICFASKSLASRFRFNLENNETLKFDVVDHASFLYWSRKDLWSQLRKPCSIPLHVPVHITLKCIDNLFAVYYNGDLKMAVKVKDYKAMPNYWYLIFWNGRPRVEFKGKQDNYMDIEISNLKIYHKA